MARRAAEAVSPGVRLVGVDMYGADGPARSVRAVLRFDGPPLFRRGELAASATSPRQTFFEFENVHLGPDVQLPRRFSRGGISSVYWQPRGDDGRLVFDLTLDAHYRLFSLGAPPRLLLDVSRPAASQQRSRTDAPLVLLDPGHGGGDHGAVGFNGLTEAHLALDLARRVRRWLGELAPELRVRLTRDSDVLLSLEERAAMANAFEAVLFLSIHLNASSKDVEKGGVSSFVLDVNNERNVRRLAARENGTRTDAVSELQFLVGSLARSEQGRESRAAATFIQQGTLLGGRRLMPHLHDRGVRSAMFYVLVGAQMPAVLLEASFLTEPDEAEALAQPAHRDGLAEGIARGVAEYLREGTQMR